jgi:Fe-S-cluster containining protein
MSNTFDCSKCPGYCCSYPNISITKRDVQRLAKHFGLSFAKAKKKFTMERYDEDYVMRRKADIHFGRVCQFFDTEKRCCTIYEARPSTCRNYPHGKRCGYWDFLVSERDLQEDPEHVAGTWNI